MLLIFQDRCEIGADIYGMGVAVPIYKVRKFSSFHPLVCDGKATCSGVFFIIDNEEGGKAYEVCIFDT